jgi:hypothetical protein
VELSRATRRVINQNFLLGLAFVAGGMVLSAMKYISPIMAALFHVAGSLLVVFNSFRLVRLGECFEPHPSAVVALPPAKRVEMASRSGRIPLPHGQPAVPS